MRKIETNGIIVEAMNGYWGMDYTGGDLYEAEELFQLFVRYPDGKVIQPVASEKGKNFGCLRCLLNTVKSASIRKRIQRGGTLNPILDYTVSGQQNKNFVDLSGGCLDVI